MALNRAGSCNPAVVKVGIVFLGLCLVGYVVGPPLYWHVLEGLAAVRRSSSAASCPPCNCNCDSQPLPSIPQGLINSSFSDCAKHDPEVNGDTENNFSEVLSEELKLREAEASENRQHADVVLLEAKKLTSQYQKEADKCNSGMETCEEAREKAESAFLAQKQNTEMWELRARQRGWKESNAKSRTQSKGGLEVF